MSSHLIHLFCMQETERHRQREREKKKARQSSIITFMAYSRFGNYAIEVG
jgi:hypothetical protein